MTAPEHHPDALHHGITRRAKYHRLTINQHFAFIVLIGAVYNFISVDFPAPFSPPKPTISPGLICRLIFCKARTPGNDLPTFLNSSIIVTSLFADVYD